MSGIMSMVLGAKTAIAAAVDAYFNLVTLLLPGNGTNGAQNNTFLDSSTNNFTITRNGGNPGMTQGTFSPFSQTGWGNYFGGDGNYLSTAYSADFDFGTGDFSIEAWVYPIDAGRGTDSSKFGTIISQGASGVTTNFWGFYLLISGSNVTQVLFDVGASTALSATSLTYPINTWHHFVVCRSGTTLSLFVDGTRVATATYSSAINANSSGTVQVARYAYGSPYQNWLQGNISNVRVLKGSSAYSASSSTLTVPTASLTDVTNTKLLTCLSNRFVDANTQVTAKTITVNGTPSVQPFSPFAPTAAYSASTNGGSGYFDGTGDNLTYPAGTSQQFGTSNFTVECWVYFTADPHSSGTFIIDARDASNTSNWALYFGSGNSITWFKPSGTSIADSTVYKQNTWYHVAYVRSGTTGTIYVNGASAATGTDNENYTVSNNTTYIAGRYTSDFYLRGYMSGFRILKGTAQYTAAFTPPTAPPTAITNTQLLLNFTNAGITDATAKNDLETVGNAQISTTQSKFGGSSMYFDGNGDYLIRPTSPLFAIGTGDFTIECWYYKSANGVNGNDGIICTSTDGNATGGYYVELSSTRGFYFRVGSNTYTNTTTTYINDSTWHHFALSRSGSSLKFFIDGVSQTLSSSTSTDNMLANGNIVVGAIVNASNVPTYFFNGYIDDLRVTRYARYTSNFTPPTAAFALQ